MRREGAWVANDHSFTRSSSLGEYIAMVSGQYTRCEANNDLPDHCHQLAIRFAPPIALWDWSGRRFTGERPVGVWIGCQRTLEEAVEEQPAVA